MKLFAVYADVELVGRPAWLDDYRAQYDKPYPLHITLKQPCYIDPKEVSDIRQKLTRFIKGLHVPGHTLRLTFDHVITDEADGSIMLTSNHPDLLFTLQRDLVAALGTYTYYEPESKAWEQNF